MTRLRYFIQGRFLGHPVHPMMVHFPLVLVPAAVVLDILSMTTAGGQNLYVRTAFYVLLIGVILGAAAAVFGLIDFFYELSHEEDPARPTAIIHASGMSIFLLMQIVSLSLRGASLGAAATPVPAFVLSLVGMVLMLTMSWFGGRLVYHWGIRVEPVGDRERLLPPSHREPLPPNVLRFPFPRLHLRRKK